MSGSLYGCPKQSIQISDFSAQNVSKLTIWACSDYVTMQLCIWCESTYVCSKKSNMTRSQSHWALCICAHDSQDVAGLASLEGYISHWTGSLKFRSPPETRCQNQGHVPDIQMMLQVKRLRPGMEEVSQDVQFLFGIKFLAKRATISGHTWCGAMACEQTFDKITKRIRFIRP